MNKDITLLLNISQTHRLRKQITTIILQSRKICYTKPFRNSEDLLGIILAWTTISGKKCSHSYQIYVSVLL